MPGRSFSGSDSKTSVMLTMLLQAAPNMLLAREAKMEPVRAVGTCAHPRT